MKDSPQSSRPMSQTVTCAVVAAFAERSPQEGPGDEVILAISDTDMRVCHKACALLLECFLTALSHGKVLFSDKHAVYCSSLS